MDRLDKALYKRNIFESREKAKIEILNSNIEVNGTIIKKPAYLIEENDIIKVLGYSSLFVGRGGEKLKEALTKFKINLNNKIAIDVGASTGGFTDCMLQNNIKKVYAIDVGKDQLHESLRRNDKVIVMENTDIRKISAVEIAEEIDFFTVDVSFISITKIIKYIKNIINKNATGVILLKPQFEVGKAYVGKNGIVRDKESHIKLLRDINEFLYNNKFYVINIIQSPITGKKGNIEYLLHVNNNINEKTHFNYEFVVKNAFLSMKK